MKNIFFLVYFGILSFLIGGLQTLAVHSSLYFKIWWFDIPMHIFGGIWVSFIIFVISILVKKESLLKGFYLKILIVSILIVGVIWEILELFFDATYILNNSYWFDTSSDIVISFCGAMIGYIVLSRWYKLV